MPDRPCTGWALNGNMMPRGAGAGAGMMVKAGRMAWPSSTAGYLVWPAAEPASTAVAAAVESSVRRIIDAPPSCHCRLTRHRYRFLTVAVEQNRHETVV